MEALGEQIEMKKHVISEAEIDSHQREDRVKKAYVAFTRYSNPPKGVPQCRATSVLDVLLTARQGVCLIEIGCSPVKGGRRLGPNFVSRLLRVSIFNICGLLPGRIK